MTNSVKYAVKFLNVRSTLRQIFPVKQLRKALCDVETHAVVLVAHLALGPIGKGGASVAEVRHRIAQAGALRQVGHASRFQQFDEHGEFLHFDELAIGQDTHREDPVLLESDQRAAVGAALIGQLLQCLDHGIAGQASVSGTLAADGHFALVVEQDVVHHLLSFRHRRHLQDWFLHWRGDLDYLCHFLDFLIVEKLGKWPALAPHVPSAER